MAVGKDQIANFDGARQIARILRERSALGAIEAIYQEMAKFMNFKRTDKTMDVYLMGSDVLRETTEARMFVGSGFPGEFVSILRIQSAPLSKNGEIPPLASIQNTPAFPVLANRIRRLLGPRGDAARQDVKLAANLNTVS